MPKQQIQWQVQPSVELPQWFIQAVKSHVPELSGNYVAQLLWQRGIRDAKQLAGFLNPQMYQPASPFEFGQEMRWAVERLQQARKAGERVAIWGDFDADGITATAVLWEGLGQFFSQNSQLVYYIPNRLTESHGLNNQGIDDLVWDGTGLIVTCDTGSTNISEIEYARSLEVDVIVTDHHTLPSLSKGELGGGRPPVTAIINPRYLPRGHQMFHLSGVAVAYKLVEALYETLPDVPQQPLEDLLDLVAIGLIADLVQLIGDCRYLAQQGIECLQQQAKKRNRPGVARLLELCQRSGDRPTDISFGLGPRINAVSRIQGDASFCVELLTSRDQQRTQKLAEDTELANARRKALQKDVAADVQKKLTQMDLSTTSVIVLWDAQWSVGVLGLVAGQVAQEYGRPTILLSTEQELGENVYLDSPLSLCPSAPPLLARGSARSANGIDLYELVKAQAHLLHRFGGHPLAAGLSLPVENIPLFTQAINQQLRQQVGDLSDAFSGYSLQADLVCTVRELGKDLFRELKLLEPCGMGNPVPKLLIQNCWFENVWNRNTQDLKGRKVQYIKTELEIWDDSSPQGFPGLWWGHYKDEVPQGRCDAIVELDFNNHASKKRPEVRLIAVQPRDLKEAWLTPTQVDWILDWRNLSPESNADCPESENSKFSAGAGVPSLQHSALIITECPTSWDELQVWLRRAIQTNQKLAIAYPDKRSASPQEIWQQLVGIAKFLSRTGKSATLAQLHEKLGLKYSTIQLGIQALSHLGFEVKYQESGLDGPEFLIQHSAPEAGLTISVDGSLMGSTKSTLPPQNSSQLSQFIAAVQEEQFHRRYFCLVPLSTIQSMARQTLGTNIIKETAAR